MFEAPFHSYLKFAHNERKGSINGCMAQTWLLGL